MGNHTGTIAGGGTLKEQLKVVEVYPSTPSNTGDVSPDGIDRRGYNSILFLVQVDETSGSGTYTPSIVHGDVAATLTAPAAALLGLSDTPSAFSADGLQTIYADCRSLKRYVGIKMTAASSPTYTIGIIAVLGASTGINPTA
jgi:hypothetical protein